MSEVSQKCQELEPIISGLGYELVAVDYEKKSNGYNLTFYIDSPNGISLDDCEKVHNAISDPLDQLDPTDGKSYILNVSSLGLDWAFRTDRDYQKNLNQMVDVKLFSAVERKKSYTGKLVSFSADQVTIFAQKQISLDRKNIAKICKHIEF